jgi:hypothetical protein
VSVELVILKFEQERLSGATGDSLEVARRSRLHCNSMEAAGFQRWH